MKQMIKYLTEHPESYREAWNGFSEESFILSATSLAKQELESAWLTIHRPKLRNGDGLKQTYLGNDFMGINLYLLKLAIGEVSM